MNINEDRRISIKEGIYSSSRLLKTLKDIECEVRADFDEHRNGQTMHEYTLITRLTDSISFNLEHLRTILIESESKELEKIAQ